MMAVWIVWLKGRKTYLVAALVCVLVLVSVFMQWLTPQLALVYCLFALSLFAVTFRSALAAHQADVLALLQSLAAAGVAARRHDASGLRTAGVEAASGALRVESEISAEGGTKL